MTKNPDVHVYHDVLTEGEMEQVKQAATPLVSGEQRGKYLGMPLFCLKWVGVQFGK